MDVKSNVIQIQQHITIKTKNFKVSTLQFEDLYYLIKFNIFLLLNNCISKNSKLLRVQYSTVLSINSTIMIILKHFNCD